MLDSSALFLTVVSVDSESFMIQLGSIMYFVDGENSVKDAPTCGLVTPSVYLSVDGQLS